MPFEKAPVSVEKIVKSWKSGSVRGYNGDGIRLTGTYLLQSGEDAPSVIDLRFFDNSTQANGPSSRLRSFAVNTPAWVDVPMPDPDGTFGEGVNTGFSMMGRIRTTVQPTGIYVQVDFGWGEDQVHKELGLVMCLNGVADPA